MCMRGRLGCRHAGTESGDGGHLQGRLSERGRRKGRCLPQAQALLHMQQRQHPVRLVHACAGLRTPQQTRGMRKQAWVSISLTQRP